MRDVRHLTVIARFHNGPWDEKLLPLGVIPELITGFVTPAGVLTWSDGRYALGARMRASDDRMWVQVNDLTDADDHLEADYWWIPANRLPG